MAERRTDHIQKSSELSEELDTLTLSKGWNRSMLAKSAGISNTTVGRIFDVKDKAPVSRVRFARVVVSLTDDTDKAAHLFDLAGIKMPPRILEEGFVAKLVREIDGLGLDSVNEHLLQEKLLADVRLYGRILRDGQSFKE